MNEYYELWLEHKENFEMPTLPTSDSNLGGPYWNMDRMTNTINASKQTANAFRMAAAISVIDGPLPFIDVISFTAASVYSAAWWYHALA